MKKIILLILLLLLGFAVNAQSREAYEKAMEKGLQAMSTAQTAEELQAAASQFERISARVHSQWHPYYYAALNYINLSFRAEGIPAKDRYAAKAQEFIDKALEVAPNHAEIVALQGYNYMVQLAADPNTRGQLLSPKAMQQFGMAMKLDPENPRAMALMAQMQYGAAQFFGSSTEDACALVKKSLPLFDTRQQKEGFDPTWGKAMAENLAGQCDPGNTPRN